MTYKEQLEDPRWLKKRIEILTRDSLTCQICWDTTTQLHVHHKYYHPSAMAWEYPNEALVTLCRDCHKIEEYLKKENRNAVIAVKKYDHKRDFQIVCVIVIDDENVLSISIFKITAKKHLTFIINHQDASKYSMKDLLDDTQKLI